jgi:hypothetical protein
VSGPGPGTTRKKRIRALYADVKQIHIKTQKRFIIESNSLLLRIYTDWVIIINNGKLKMPFYISISLIAIGIIIQLLNKFNENYKETIEKVPYLKIVLFGLSIVLTVFGGYQTIYSVYQSYQEKKYEIYASPSEIELMPRTNKNSILTVSNDKDFAIFDVNLSICCDNKSIDSSFIKIDPVEKDVIPDVPFSIAIITLSNGCSIMLIHSIDPHSTKKFYFSIKGENIEVNSRISFRVYDWAREPSSFNISTTKEQFPEYFQEYFGDKSPDTEKASRVFCQRWRASANPYFPKQNESKVLSISC